MSDKYIILDRDGVINIDSKDYIKSPDEWVAIQGSLSAIAKLNQAGYHVVIATNQSAIARGLISEKMLDRIHAKMLFEVNKHGGKILDIFYCPHHPDDNCLCRKPKPGLLLQFSKKYNVDLSLVCMVGDNIKDILAAKAVGSAPHLVLTNYANITNSSELEDVKQYKNLAEFVDIFLNLP
jgi:D-glycero-D-manno-heptose 1,7-bisphosphate phosphatase